LQRVRYAHVWMAEHSRSFLLTIHRRFFKLRHVPIPPEADQNA
jgi:hypothetical protein